MLFPYKYVPHKMEEMQVFIDFIFHEVWCKAPSGGPFNTNLFVANPGLHEVMLAFQWGHTQAGDLFYSQVERIYGLFALLPPAQITQLQQWFQGNNDLEKVCANDPALHLARYADIAVAHRNLSEELATFFKGLYSQSLLDLVALREKIGDIDDHYKTFMGKNNSGKCPFCGIADMQGTYHSTREAYDHYLPKTLYPFNSINFHNLVPACHHCNSSYKTSKDPAYTPKDPTRAARRRKVFYPYTVTPYVIDLQVHLGHSDIEKLTPDDVSLQFGPPALNEEIETWRDIYGIDERYKAKFCMENDGKYWLMAALDEWTEDDRSPADCLAALARMAAKYPYADCNFLRKPFLDACQQAGIFEIGQNGT
jgi:hypothetical protein